MIVLLLLQGYDIAVEPFQPTTTYTLMHPDSDAPVPVRLTAINRRVLDGAVDVPVPEDYAAHVSVQSDDGTVLRRPAESPATSGTRKLAFGEFFGREIDVAPMLRDLDEGIYYVSWKLGEAVARPMPIVVIRPYRVKVETNLGEFSIELFPQVAPRTVLNFVRLVRENFYAEKGRTFHRIEKGFVIQGGCPNDDGTGNTEFIPDELHPLAQHEPGAVSMANQGKPDSGSCQFFICLDALPNLNRRHTVFGRIVDERSFETIDAIAQVETNHQKCPSCDDGPCTIESPKCSEHHDHRPLSPVTIKKTTLEVMK